MPDTPPVLYAKSGDVHVAYMSLGDGPETVVLTPGATSNVTTFAIGPAVYEALGGQARVIWFDKRGTGLSDRVANFSFEERIDDIRAVMDSAGVASAHLCGLSEGGPMSILFSASYPERVRSLTIYGSFASWMRRSDYPFGINLSLHDYDRWVDQIEAAFMGDPDALRSMVETFCPTMAADESFREMWLTNLRMTASPGAARLVWELLYEADVRHALAGIRVPTAVVHVTGDRVCPVQGGRYIAAHIPGARMIELPGIDHYNVGLGTEFFGAIRDNIALASKAPGPDAARRLATVLFTDIVDSTSATARAGDREWRARLDKHDAIAGSIVSAHQGKLIKSTGDGLLATFEGPSRAVRCAAELHSAVADLGISIRAGLHAGEIEVRGEDVAGLAVVVASRVSNAAGPGETLVTGTVKDLTLGSGFAFEDIGERVLKGLDEPWRLLRLQN